MPPHLQNAFKRAPARLFGLNRETREPSAPLTVTQDTSVWEIYSHEAENTDRERIKDWNDSLNTLLIFVRTTYMLVVCITLTSRRRHCIQES